MSRIPARSPHSQMTQVALFRSSIFSFIGFGPLAKLSAWPTVAAVRTLRNPHLIMRRWHLFLHTPVAVRAPQRDVQRYLVTAGSRLEPFNLVRPS